MQETLPSEIVQLPSVHVTFAFEASPPAETNFLTIAAMASADALPPAVAIAAPILPASSAAPERDLSTISACCLLMS